MATSNLSQVTQIEFNDLLTQLASDDPAIQKAAQETLEKLCYLRWPRSYMLGTEVAEHSDAQAQFVSQSAAVPWLREALRQGHPRVRVFAANVLSMARDGAAVPLLIEALGAAQKEVCLAAASALASLADSRAIEPLLQMLRDPDYEIRGGVASALGSLGADQAVPALMTLLTSKNWQDRQSALYGLGYLLVPLYGNAARPPAPSATDALPAIRQALADPHRAVRKAAKGALSGYDWHRRRGPDDV